MLKFDFLENERLPDEHFRPAKRYVSKTRVIVIIVLFVLAVIIVGLLCGLLAGRKACPSRNTQVSRPPFTTHSTQLITSNPPSARYSESTTQSATINPRTKLPTTIPPPLEPWDKPRLPEDIKPSHYDLDIRIDIDDLQWFNGTITVMIRCITTTNLILMHAKQLDMIPGTASLERVTGDASVVPGFAKMPWTHTANQYLVVELNGWLVPQEMYRFSIGFGAELVDEGLVGLYRSSYKTANGETRYVAATFFAPTNARMAFPCFDEPAMKATYNISIVHQPGYNAISNMPLLRTENVTMGAGQDAGEGSWIRSVFEKTKPMPSYVVCYVVCDFVKETKLTADGVEFSIWAREDALSSVEYALEKGAAILDYFNFYFSTDFPLPKMDSVAIPDFGVGAMENWGLMTFREALLLFTPGESSASNLQAINTVMSHELAHQWFGNLVSFEWWNDLWLKEGFATYVGNLGTNITEPEWGMGDQFVGTSLFQALEADSAPSSRPVIVDVYTADDINQQYDFIVYSKGASIIRMIHDFLGETNFRRGLEIYIDRYKYSNAVALDLWNCFTESANGTGIDVRQIMDTWTLQMGYPTVYVTREYSSSNPSFSANQSRFLIDPDANTTTGYEDLGYQWYIPMRYTTKNKANFDNAPLQWLTPDSIVTMPLPGTSSADWLLVNINSYGYYRVNYDDHNWRLLIDQLLAHHQKIPISNRAALIGDALNLARAGDLSYVTALNLTRYLTNETDYVPWLAATKSLGYMKLMLSRASPYGSFQNYILRLVEPLYNSVGWDDSNSSHLEQLTRVIAVREACNYGNAECISIATSMFQSWMSNYSFNPIPASQKKNVYCTAVAQGGQAEWTFAFNQYESTIVASERAVLLEALACASEPWILSQYLEMTLDQIKSQDAASVVGYVAMNPIGYDLAWRFFQTNWSFFRKTYGRTLFQFARLIEAVTAHFNTESSLRELENFISQHEDQGTGARALVQVVERTRANVRWVQKHQSDVETWLRWIKQD